MRRGPSALAAALALATALPLGAQSPPRAGDFRLPPGPVTITADRAEFEQSGVMLYRGRVRLVSGPLELTGERLELKQPAPGQYEASVSGRPAHLAHAATEGRPAVSASADEIRYDSRTGLVDLVDNVELDRGGDTIAGDRMQYDVAARRITAAGDKGGQVRIVITPPEGADDAAQGTRPRGVAPGG